MIQETIGTFGFHFVGDRDVPRPVCPNVRLYVKSSALSRAADLAISPCLASDADIDRFVDDAIAALQRLRSDAKQALTSACQS
jgi:hypothetical protein